VSNLAKEKTEQTEQTVTEIAQVPAPKKFMAMKYEWPVDSCTNSNFSIKKGEIIRFPGGTIDENMFATFATYEEASAFVRKQPVEIPSYKITTTETMYSKLRKVNFPNADGSPGKDGWLLRDKDIPEELSPPMTTRDILRDIEKLDDEDTLMKMFEIEKRSDKRKTILDKLKEKLKI